MIGLQSSLDRILTHLQNPPQTYLPTPASATTTRFLPTGSGGGRPSPPTSFPTTSEEGASTSAAGGPESSMGGPNVVEVGSRLNNGAGDKPRFPPLPGFAPPPHKYGIVPSTAPSSDDDSEDNLPRVTLNAPIEALRGLANAAAEVAATDQPRYVLSFFSL
jgi:hypothetical protein